MNLLRLRKALHLQRWYYFSTRINTPCVRSVLSFNIHAPSYKVLHTPGRGRRGIGPIYSLPPFIQSRQGIADYFGPLFRVIKPWLFRGAKDGAQTLGCAALQTGSHILSDIADNPGGYKDISKHIRGTLPAKLAGSGRRKRRRPPSRTRRPSAKRHKRAPSTRRKPRGKTLSENVGLLGPL